MDLQQLKVFREAAKSGGFTRASAELRLSQSTVSLHIKRLEEELGCPLFLRARKRVYLNDAGRLLLEHAERIFSAVRDAEMALGELTEQQRGIIRLGSGATTLTYLLPRILGAQQKRHPEIELVVTTGSSEMLALAVHQQKLDMAVVMQPVDPSLSIEWLPLFREELVFIVSSSHPITEKRSLQADDVKDIPFISFHEGTAMRSHVDRELEALQIVPRVTMEFENIEAIKAMVRAGLGGAILPACSVQGSQAALRAMRFREHRMGRELLLALPKSAYVPRSIANFANRLAKGLTGKNVQQLRESHPGAC